jgi:hypothetical protein
MALDLTMQITADASQAKAELRSLESEVKKVENTNKTSVSWWQKEEQAIDEVTGVLTTHRGELSKVEQAAEKMAASVETAAVSSSKLGGAAEVATAQLLGTSSGVQSLATQLLEMTGASELSIGALVGVTGALGAALGAAALFAGFLAKSAVYYEEHADAAKGLRDELGAVQDAWNGIQFAVGGAVMDGANAPMVALLKLGTDWATEMGLKLAADIMLMKELANLGAGGAFSTGGALIGGTDIGAIPDPRKVLGGAHPIGSLLGPREPSFTSPDALFPLPAAAAQAEFERQQAEEKRAHDRIVREMERVAEARARMAKAIQDLVDHGISYEIGFPRTIPGTPVNLGAAGFHYASVPKVADDYGLPGWPSTLPGTSIKGGDNLLQGLLTGPSFLSRLFGKGGLGSDLGHTLEHLLVERSNPASALGASVGGSVFGTLMQKGEDGSASGLSKLLTGALGSKIGGAVGSFIPFGGQILGSLVGKLFGGLFGESQGHKDLMAGNKQITDLKKQLDDIYGSATNAQAAAKMFGVDLAGAWGDQNLKGAEHFKGLMDELTRKQAQFNTDLGGTLGQIQALGGNIPEALRPYLQQLTDAKVLTQDNIDLIAQMAGDSVPSFAQVQEAAERLGISTDHLSESFHQMAANASWQSIIDDLDTLARSGEDLNALFGSDSGLQKTINDLVNQSIKFGTTIPENMKPWIQKLIDSGKLIGENGEAITDIDKLHFGETMQTTLDRLNDTLKELVDTLKIALPDAVHQAGQAWTDTVHGLPAFPDPGGHHGGHRPGQDQNDPGDGQTAVRPASSQTFRPAAAAVRPASSFQAVAIRPAAATARPSAAPVPIHLELHMDGRQVAQSVVPHIPGVVTRLGLTR